MNSRKEIFYHVCEIINSDLVYVLSLNQLEVITDNTDFIEDFGGDEFDLLEIILTMNNEFNIKLPLNLFDVKENYTIKVLVDEIWKRYKNG